MFSAEEGYILKMAWTTDLTEEVQGIMEFTYLSKNSGLAKYIYKNKKKDIWRKIYLLKKYQ